MRTALVAMLVLVLVSFAHAHEVATGDPAHDENHLAPQAYPDYNQDVPMVLIFFAGLLAVAFAMGAFLGPKKTRKR